MTENNNSIIDKTKMIENFYQRLIGDYGYQEGQIGKNVEISHDFLLIWHFGKQKTIRMLIAFRISVSRDRDKATIVKELTNDMWSVQEQNVFLNSNDDILLVEGWTDEAYISKALEMLQKQGKYHDLKFAYLPCNGSSNVKMMSEKFHPKRGQMMIAVFDDDKAGWNAIRSVFSLAEDYDKKTFGKAQKKGDIWYMLIPAKKVDMKGDFNIEDYFDREVFLSLVMQFRKLNEIKSKDNFKQLLANKCKNNQLEPQKYEKFHLLFDLLEEIKQAEQDGKAQL